MYQIDWAHGVGERETGHRKTIKHPDSYGILVIKRKCINHHG